MRNGMYAVFQGKDYQAAPTDDQFYKLFTTGDDVPAGFRHSEYEPRVFVKIVKRHELDEVYLMRTFADFQGERLEVADIRGNTMILATSDQLVAQRLGMKQIDRYDFRLEVRNNEVTRVIEEKEILS